ncbi:metallophosphoesterase family protein [Flavihumibacter sp. CACIAM 22H1]|uniref:metallophosphoesterase family protein n=1 Tax=Flavihumibacter sp. CACIAM 22H1 TaxID=1812911 RepID=UPI0007A8F059|nr:metallophosphoesterase family protein [Flavihumibacter sp. CACIAM 22H1]KYP14744.1 MAG: phosphodiesterase [Flavihumibacter sp. CACIAM 22H1]
MTRIGLLSDTHGFLDPQVFRHFKECHEIWHAGDFGNAVLLEDLKTQAGVPVRGVYGNIDGQDIRSIYPEDNVFECEGITVLMKHIGGYPGRYAPGVKNRIQALGARLFIAGHSHILKIQYDQQLKCLHINPGAAGKQGWHKMRTLVRFSINQQTIQDCEVIELGKKT